jgi:predicted XRE-type DNA-binding protein
MYTVRTLAVPLSLQSEEHCVMTSIDNPIARLKEQLRQVIVEDLKYYEQRWAATLLGIDQPRISAIRNGDLRRISLERLIIMLASINRRVDLTVTRVGPIMRRRPEER